MDSLQHLDGLERLLGPEDSSFQRRESGDPAQAVFDSDVDVLRRWLESRGEENPDLMERLRSMRAVLRDFQTDTNDWIRDGAWDTPPALAEVAVPAGLPAELTHYLEGAVAYHQRDLDGAISAWQTLLGLPEERRRERTVQAHLMLGRSFARTGDAAPARHHFGEVRRLAAEGWRDDLGLAFESTGWQARLELEQEDFAEALRLYAHQLVAGDPSAPASLKWTSSRLLHADKSKLDDVARDPAARWIYSLYLAAMDLSYLEGEMMAWLEAVEKQTQAGSAVQAENPAEDPAQGPAEDPKSIDGADALAWVAYQNGRFDLAERWLPMASDDSPHAAWLASKLAARAGDLDASRSHLDEAARRMAALDKQPIIQETEDSTWTWQAGQRVRAEAAALELDRGKYGDALEEMLEAGYWADAAYIAERVMSLDEFKAYVEQHWPENRPGPEGAAWAWVDPGALTWKLRHVLAKRLAREDRWTEALPFYPEGPLRRTVRELIEQRRLADDPSSPDLERGRALWNMSQTLREKGLALIGTELDPDWALWEGDFDLGRFRRSAAPPGEIDRAQKSLPEPPKRFHYRYVAADLGWRAALLMPDGSEETADVLFTAGTWLKNLDAKRADRFYKALVRRCGETPIGREADRRRWFPPAR